MKNDIINFRYLIVKNDKATIQAHQASQTNRLESLCRQNHAIALC